MSISGIDEGPGLALMSFLSLLEEREHLLLILNKMVVPVLAEGLNACRKRIDEVETLGDELVIVTPDVLRRICEVHNVTPEDMCAKVVTMMTVWWDTDVFHGTEAALMGGVAMGQWIGLRRVQ